MQTLFRLGQMSLEFTGVYFTQEFFSYLETSDEALLNGLTLTPESSQYETLLYYLAKNRGFVVLMGITLIEWPKQLLDDIFHKLLDSFLGKIREA